MILVNYRRQRGFSEHSGRLDSKGVQRGSKNQPRGFKRVSKSFSEINKYSLKVSSNSQGFANRLLNIFEWLTRHIERRNLIQNNYFRFLDNHSNFRSFQELPTKTFFIESHENFFEEPLYFSYQGFLLFLTGILSRVYPDFIIEYLLGVLHELLQGIGKLFDQLFFP